MAVREYIGARYVPIFGRAGEETIVWDNLAPYEPLTIVTHNGNSYTSRQYVPAGIDITNTQYWALTGNYNAQIDQYRAEVATYNGRITANAEAIAANAEAITQQGEDIEELNERFANVTGMFDNLAAAKAGVTADDIYIQTAAYHAGTNIGGALYRVTDYEPGTYYETADNGLYLQLMDGHSVSQFGARGDGSTDDTDAINTAVSTLTEVDFEPGAIYKTANILVSKSGAILHGNNARLVADPFKTTALREALNIGQSKIVVDDPSVFHVNQTALVYNSAASPDEYMIVVTGINGNEVSFKSYKTFKQDDTISDTSPYTFPAGSAVYTGTTLISVMAGMNVESYGIVKDVTIENFELYQSQATTEAGYFLRLVYTILTYNCENLHIVGNRILQANYLAVMCYGYHRNVFIQGNTFANCPEFAVCSHWDMQNVSLNNRAHGFNVLDNRFDDCKFNIIYSSVDGGICAGNTITNANTSLSEGVYLYGGDIGIHTDYASQYDQESYWTCDVIVANNVIDTKGLKAGKGVQCLGATDCKIIGNLLYWMEAAMHVSASNNIDIAGNTTKYTYLGTNRANCSVGTWGMARNIFVHDNMFNTQRVMSAESKNRTARSGITSSEFYGYSDTTIYIERNKVIQPDLTTIVFIAGNTETSSAPTIMMDVPKCIMFNANTVITQATSGTITVFQINQQLADRITNTDNLQSGQMVV